MWQSVLLNECMICLKYWRAIINIISQFFLILLIFSYKFHYKANTVYNVTNINDVIRWARKMEMGFSLRCITWLLIYIFQMLSNQMLQVLPEIVLLPITVSLKRQLMYQPSWQSDQIHYSFCILRGETFYIPSV